MCGGLRYSVCYDLPGVGEVDQFESGVGTVVEDEADVVELAVEELHLGDIEDGKK